MQPSIGADLLARHRAFDDHEPLAAVQMPATTACRCSARTATQSIESRAPGS